MDTPADNIPPPGPPDASPEPVTLLLIYNALMELKELVLDLEARVARLDHGR
jgi:hypothetical protein